MRGGGGLEDHFRNTVVGLPMGNTSPAKHFGSSSVVSLGRILSLNLAAAGSSHDW